MIGPRGDARSLAASRQLQSAVAPSPLPLSPTSTPITGSLSGCRAAVPWKLSAPDIQQFIYSLEEKFL